MYFKTEKAMPPSKTITPSTAPRTTKRLFFRPGDLAACAGAWDGAAGGRATAACTCAESGSEAIGVVGSVCRSGAGSGAYVVAERSGADIASGVGDAAST